MAYFYELTLSKGDIAQCIDGVPIPFLCEIRCTRSFNLASGPDEIKRDHASFFEAVSPKTNPITPAHLVSPRWERTLTNKKEK